MEMQDQGVKNVEQHSQPRVEEVKGEDHPMHDDVEHIIVDFDENDTDYMYRLVNKEYYCYVCRLKLKKLISVQELIDLGLTCERCKQGFCEVLDQNTVDYKGIVEIGLGSNPNQVEEEKKAEIEVGQVSMLDRLHNASGGSGINGNDSDDRYRPPRVANVREDINNRSVQSD